MMPAGTTATKITALPAPAARRLQAVDLAPFGGLLRADLGHFGSSPGARHESLPCA
jgi:hypothetical protein